MKNPFMLKKTHEEILRNIRTKEKARLNPMNRANDWVPKRYRLRNSIPGVIAGSVFQQSFLSDNVYFHAIPISSGKPERDQVGIIEFEACHVEVNSAWFYQIEPQERADKEYRQ